MSRIRRDHRSGPGRPFIRSRLQLSAFVASLFCGLVLGPLPGGAVLGQVAATAVFVNELHYDNAGSDVDEGVELAGRAGTVLQGWRIRPYNGGTGGPYGTIRWLGGSIPDQGRGFGVRWFAVPGLQNGPSDGLALIDPNGRIVQFLSYEGAFTARSGPAAGLRAQDIGVTEGPGVALGRSLQLAGRGSTYQEMAWEGPIPHSRGLPNPHQTLGGAAEAERECTITGTPGDDELVGAHGPDRICGLGGNDVLMGLGGDDALDGGDGDDLLEGGAGADILEGGSGHDGAEYGGAPGSVTVHLELGTATGAEGDDVLSGVEDLFGSDLGDDHLTGRDDQENRLVGRAGNDGLFGRGLDDELFGGPGNDWHEGGPGIDLCDDVEGIDEYVNCERRHGE
jgi:Ca2+-binding RTX toxin-like protein